MRLPRVTGVSTRVISADGVTMTRAEGEEGVPSVCISRATSKLSEYCVFSATSPSSSAITSARLALCACATTKPIRTLFLSVARPRLVDARLPFWASRGVSELSVSWSSR